MSQWLSLLADNPELRLVQLLLLLTAILSIFFIFYTTRDIILRSRSFALQLVCVVLVTVLPVVGFLLYLLLRPPRTIKDRELEKLLHHLIQLHEEGKKSASTLAPAPAARPATADPWESVGQKPAVASPSVSLDDLPHEESGPKKGHKGRGRHS